MAHGAGIPRLRARRTGKTYEGASKCCGKRGKITRAKAFEVPGSYRKGETNDRSVTGRTGGVGMGLYSLIGERGLKGCRSRRTSICESCFLY